MKKMNLPKCLPIKMPHFFTNILKLLVLIVFCLLLASCGEKEIITTKDMNEANKMIVALKESGIDAYQDQTGDIGKEVYHVMVEDGFFSTGARIEAMRILQDNCLPYEPPKEIPDSGMVNSPSTELEKKKRLAQMNLEQLFRSYKGVTCVKAILVYPEKYTESLNPYDSSATVKITYKSPNPSLVEASLKEQTARTVEKLKPENVFVVLEFNQIKPAELSTSDSWKKLLVTVGVAVGLIAVLMVIVLWMRRGKPNNNEEDFDDETELIEENELNLLESGEE
jgi:type III secretory pathway lipoprotein EscJ